MTLFAKGRFGFFHHIPSLFLGWLIFSSFALILLLTSCQSLVSPGQSVHNQSLELTLNVPKRWLNSVNLEFQENAWLQDFDSPTLEALVKEAILYNYDLRAAAARLDQARQQLIIVGANRIPSVSANLEVKRSKIASEIASADSTLKPNLNFNWELDIWGRLKDSRNAAFQDWQFEKATLKGARLSLAAQTAKAWISVIEAHLKVKLSQQQAKSFAESADQAQKDYNQGLGTALNIKPLLTNLANEQARLSALERQRTQAILALELLLGRYPTETIEPANELPSIPEQIPAGLPAQLLERRPDLRAANKRVIASSYRASAAFKLLLPSINLTGVLGTSSDSLKSLLKGDYSLWSIAGNLFQPIFQGHRLRAQYEKAQRAIDEAVANYTSTALKAFREVELALSRESSLRRQIDFLYLAQQKANDEKELMEQQYRRGLVGITNVLTSERKVFTAKNDLIATQSLLLQNRIDLYLALGGEFERITHP